MTCPSGAGAVALDGFTHPGHEVAYRPECIVEAVVSTVAESVYQVAYLDELEQHVDHLREQVVVTPCVVVLAAGVLDGNTCQ